MPLSQLPESAVAFCKPNESNRGSRIAASLAGLAALALLVGCSEEKGGPQAAAGLPEAVPVLAAKVTQQSVPVQLYEIGRVEPYMSVTVRPQVAGQVAKVHFVEGQEVKAGDLLFEIDDRPFAAALRQAEANRDRDRAMAKDAHDEAARQAELLAKRVAAQREHEQAMARADAADATVRADEAMVATARLKLEYCQIRAPIAGRTGPRLVDPGNIVRENETDMVLVNQLSPIFVAFSLPEKHLAEVKARMAAEPGKLRTEARAAGEDWVEVGSLTFLDNQVDTATGTVQLKATFANERRRLWPGRFVNVTLTLREQPDALLVPASAVQASQSGGEFVYIVSDKMTVEARNVVTGLRRGDFVALDSGVKPGETVVTDGQVRLVPGAAVVIKQGLHAATQSAHSSAFTEMRSDSAAAGNSPSRSAAPEQAGGASQ